MRMQRALGVSFAALVLSTGAFTQEAQSGDQHGNTPNRGSAGFGSPDQYIAPASRQPATLQVVGRLTATGERLDTAHPTAAHRSLPMHSLVKVTNLKNGRSVVVTINDRGPFIRGRIIDLTPAGARALGFSGLTRVTVERMG